MRCCKCNCLQAQYRGDGHWYCTECWAEESDYETAKKDFTRGIYEECDKEDRKEEK